VNILYYSAVNEAHYGNGYQILLDCIDIYHLIGTYLDYILFPFIAGLPHPRRLLHPLDKSIRISGLV